MQLFENSVDISSILHLPYPLYQDIMLKRIKEKQKETAKTSRMTRDMKNTMQKQQQSSKR